MNDDRDATHDDAVCEAIRSHLETFWRERRQEEFVWTLGPIGRSLPRFRVRRVAQHAREHCVGAMAELSQIRGSAGRKAGIRRLSSTTIGDRRARNRRRPFAPSPLPLAPRAGRERTVAIRTSLARSPRSAAGR